MYATVNLTGRVATNPRITHGPQGPLAHLSVSVIQRCGSSTRPQSIRHRVLVQDETAIDEITDHVFQGSLVQCTGELTYVTYETEDGKRHRSAHILVAPPLGAFHILPRGPATSRKP